MTLRTSKSSEAKALRRKLSRDLDLISKGLDTMICYELDLAKEEILTKIADLEEAVAILARITKNLVEKR
jgi:hypothetical protein